MLSRDLVPTKARMRQPGVDRQAATGGARNHKQPLPIVDVDKSAEIGGLIFEGFGLEIA
jgi:hypothetical protein